MMSLWHKNTKRSRHWPLGFSLLRATVEGENQLALQNLCSVIELNPIAEAFRAKSEQDVH
jgi:hypothetical protein